MGTMNRRDLLRRGAAAAGWTAFACGLAPGARAGDTAGTISTQGFLDAVIGGDVERVRAWLERDPGLLHVRDGAGRSAFALSLLHGQRDMAQLLRDRGYSPDLHESALAVDWERFESLAESAPGLLNQDHPVGGTAMYAAAIGGAGTQIWRVYRHGGEPNVAPRKDAGYTPLRAALEFPDLPTAELTAATLLGNGADPNGPQAGGSTPLHAAARRGSAEIVELLLRKDAAVGSVDAAGRTALELAVESGHTRVAGLLRDERAIPRDHSTSRRAYDAEGRPYRAPDLAAFSYASRGGLVGVSHTDFEAVRAAVERHPPLVHAVATTTEGAVEAGAHMGRNEIVDYLLERGAPCSLPTAVMRNDLARARQLLDEDPLRIHERGPHDFALLWYPVIGRNLLDMLELLLERGAEVERQHWLGTTALHYAAIGGQIEMAALLIEHGADVNRVGRKFDPQGLTPLQMAEARGHEELAKLLRQRGARG